MQKNKHIRTLSLFLFFILWGNLFLTAQTKKKNVYQNKTDEFQLYKVDKNVKVPTASPEAVENWKNKRFGMFIHWGPISQMGVQLSHSRNSPSHHPGGKPYKVAKIPPEVYDAQYKTFNPVQYNPDSIVALAQKTGMKYLVFTAKHHAGFSMFDSKVTDYDIMSSPYHKDILKMLEQACRKQDFGFGFYYSPRDWHHPDCDSKDHHDRYIEFYKAQMKELLTNYGPIFEIWFDGLGPGNWGNTSLEIMQMIRKLQPDAMVNDRGGVGADFYTPEHTVSYFNNKENWEACHTTTGQWGYNPKTKAKPLWQLMEILLYTWGGDGNMLLNIGPRGDGSLNPEEVKRLEQIARWWSVNGETSIRNSRGGPYLPGEWGVSTRKGNKIYLHIFRWPENKDITFPAIPGIRITGAKLLNGKPMKYKNSADGFVLSIPKNSREKIVTTVEMTADKDIMSVEPLLAQRPLTLDAKIVVSQNPNEVKNLTDQNALTNWTAKNDKNNTKEIWIEADFEKPVTITSIVLGRGDQWYPRFKPELQIPDDNGGWKTVYKWKPKFQPVKMLKKPVKTQKVRLKVNQAKQFYLAEFELYGHKN